MRPEHWETGKQIIKDLKDLKVNVFGFGCDGDPSMNEYKKNAALKIIENCLKEDSNPY